EPRQPEPARNPATGVRGTRPLAGPGRSPGGSGRSPNRFTFTGRESSKTKGTRRVFPRRVPSGCRLSSVNQRLPGFFSSSDEGLAAGVPEAEGVSAADGVPESDGVSAADGVPEAPGVADAPGVPMAFGPAASA